MTKRLLALATLVASFSVLCHEVYAQSDYRCTVERVESAKANSVSVEVHRSLIGQQFTVDYRTGLMAGALKNSYVTEPQVIDHGSKDNAYKVVTTMRVDQGAGAGSNVYALIINEYESGPFKSFAFPGQRCRVLRSLPALLS